MRFAASAVLVAAAAAAPSQIHLCAFFILARAHVTATFARAPCCSAPPRSARSSAALLRSARARARIVRQRARSPDASPTIPSPITAYTGVVGELAVDFVSTSKAGYAAFSSSVVGPFTTVNTTSFHFTEIGEMHQATLATGVTAPGKAVFYKVGGDDGESAVFPVFPVPARGAQEKFAVFGDFGLACV